MRRQPLLPRQLAALGDVNGRYQSAGKWLVLSRPPPQERPNCEDIPSISDRLHVLRQSDSGIFDRGPTTNRNLHLESSEEKKLAS